MSLGRAARELRSIGGRWSSRRWPKRASGILCIALLALLTVIQVGHVHSVTNDADQCPLCLAMHSAAPVSPTTPALVMTHAAAPVPVPVVLLAQRYWHATLYNRPPPQSL